MKREVIDIYEPPPNHVLIVTAKHYWRVEGSVNKKEWILLHKGKGDAILSLPHAIRFYRVRKYGRWAIKDKVIVSVKRSPNAFIGISPIKARMSRA